ncbi:hypothetical protein GCM10010478_07780 [Streptomyces erythrogriseus]|uniref:Zinc finger CGNR domain-containing protein n=2 Tax=Streptomyces TaxID=1883 RepID=A0ABN3WEF4_9ACTN
MTIGAPSPGMPFRAPTQYLPYTPNVVGGRRRRTDRSRAVRSVQHPPEEAAQVSRDDVRVALQKEVTAVDQVHRWCSMAVCGNREKARRHYRRTR